MAVNDAAYGIRFRGAGPGRRRAHGASLLLIALVLAPALAAAASGSIHCNDEQYEATRAALKEAIHLAESASR